MCSLSRGSSVNAGARAVANTEPAQQADFTGNAPLYTGVSGAGIRIALSGEGIDDAHRDFRGVGCGLALTEQFTDTIPTGPHDRSVHLLVTDERVRRFRKPA